MDRLLESLSRFARPHRLHAKLYPYELLVLTQVMALHLLLHFRGPGLRPIVIVHSLRDLLPAIAAPLLLAVLLRVVYAAIRGQGRRYLRSVLSWSWVFLTLRLLVCTVLVWHVYAYLKTLTPLINPNLYDEALWELDRWLFFGLSPNALFLYAFGEPAVLRVIDAGYALLFSTVLFASTPFFFSLETDRLRLAFATAASLLWLLGAWIYVAVPALGPCYAYGELWQPFAADLSISINTQHVLLENYNRVKLIPQGIVDPRLNMMEGVAAMPSLHVASQLLIALWARKVSRWLGNLLLVTVVLLTIGSVVTGWHYLVDAVAGGLLAVLCYWVAVRLYGFRFRSSDPPSSGSAQGDDSLSTEMTS